MKRSTVLATFLVVACLGFVRCYYNSEEKLYPPTSSGCEANNVTYSTTISGILSRNCYSCHGNSVSASFGGGVTLDNYTDVKSHVYHIYGAVSHQSGYPPMPQNGPMLDSCKIKAIKVWIDAGAPNN
ncbi:hypothetical protein [Parabacteroides sp. FAFU027]|uniref:hypothetical protein n=1 Tax=Parabacteroides sp. FAFU027 TaxID=2922715 RepID=UPI001FAF5F43|nr:hypothetical protein [Parabacteroides sp. FAFU027]